ncbi:hypothetical protein WJX74_007576 [Apatococcus lobatus]|uniref:Uncharacterized protein n=1 Tax=Apatococcus lobatus TaxID=904363 RepID=A0AAW1RFE2_9CHLO
MPACAGRPLSVPLCRSPAYIRQRYSSTSGLRCSATKEPGDNSDLPESIRQDMERYAQKAQQAATSTSKAAQREGAAGNGGIKEVIDKVLIADFFFVCLALVWLALGVGEQATLHSSRLLDVWFPLWQLVFQPAIGILMLGALVSGAIGRLQKDS